MRVDGAAVEDKGQRQRAGKCEEDRMIGLGRITAGRIGENCATSTPVRACETKTPPIVAIFIRVMPRPVSRCGNSALPCDVTIGT